MMDYFQTCLLQSASAGLKQQRPDGSMPPGHNNSWMDDDTPVRCTAHFAILFSFAYKWTAYIAYRDGVEQCMRYLASNVARPYGATFYCRDSNKKNRCNGLIGQAWAIEALLHGSEVLGSKALHELAEKVYMEHQFNKAYGLYYVEEIDGKRKKLDYTLNHQLIFVSMGIWLAKMGNAKIEEEVERFFSLLPENMLLSRDGLIQHHVRLGKNLPQRKLFDFLVSPYRRKITERTQGFQSFNMFSLALAKRNNPESIVWGDERIQERLQQILDYTLKPDYIRSTLVNEYSLGYRMTGAEILLFKRVFGLEGDESGPRELMKAQFKRHWNQEQGLLNKGTEDPATLSSRIYELCYLFE